MTRAPAREWWTAEALAERGLPDLPTTKRRINALAERENWRAHPTLARKRAERGGGWEYHWKLLPGRAQRRLIEEAGEAARAPADRMDRGTAWAWFDRLPEAVRQVAADRRAAVQEMEALAAHMGTAAAVAEVSRGRGVAARTLWNWLNLIDGVDPADRLAYLAPRHRAVAARAEPAGDAGASAFFDLLKADYLRLEAPSFTASYAVASRIAQAKGIPVMGERTARRRMDALPLVVRAFAREGLRGLEKRFPPQTRDRTQMVAMEGVNADCHKIDVFVTGWPGAEDAIIRPQIVAFQDLYSGKILSWRVDRDPNKVAVMSAFGELIETWGIPRHCLFDNGREFANKWLTGGAKTRFRFKVREDDPLGVLPQLGIEIHWARPHHGQAKPIERAFRDMADRIAKDARFAGAYVGNRPDAKPENYGSKAIPLGDFIRVVGEGIEQHNARAGRTSPTCRGRSFDETFAASYEVAPIRKATEEQARLWLMGQEVIRLHGKHGQASLHEAEYWSDWMSEHAGERVIARFDPEELNAGLHLYALDGSYLGFAETKVKTPFFDLAGARGAAAQDKRRKRLAKELLEATRPVTVTHIAAELDKLAAENGGVLPMPEAKVVELVQRGRGPVIQPRVPTVDPKAVDAERHEALVLQFAQASPTPAAEETYADRWRRAAEIDARAAAGVPVGTAEMEWLMRYRETPEYRSTARMVEAFGESALG